MEDLDILNLLPDNYRRVVDKPLTDLDAKRLFGLKGAHDADYTFFERLTHDHRRVDESETFKQEIATTQEAISAHMDMLSSSTLMVNFFFLCSLRAIRNGEINQGRHFPVNLEDLEITLINAEEVADEMANLSDAQVALQCGIFIAEGDAIDQQIMQVIETARTGTVVSADDAFILTDSMDVLSDLVTRETYEGMTEKERAELLLGRIKAAYDFTSLHPSI